MLLAWNGAWEEHAERIVERSYFVLEAVNKVCSPEYCGAGLERKNKNYYEIHFTGNDYVGTLFEWEGFLYQY